MAAAMNGMALHGGVIPYRRHVPGLLRLLPPGDPPRGADGPARHLRDDARFDRPRRGRPDAPAGRASRGAARHPEPLVFRPADAVETAECWQLALHDQRRPERDRAHPPEPAAGRADARRARISAPAAPMSLRRATASAEVTLFATGSEVEIARRGAEAARRPRASPRASSRCRASNCSPSSREDYRATILGDGAVPKVAIEAAVRQGWDRYHRHRRHLRRHARLRRQRRPTRSSTSISASPPKRWSKCDAPGVKDRLPSSRRNCRRRD